MAHFPGVEITLHALVKVSTADHVFQLLQKYSTHAIGCCGIGAIRAKMISMLTGRLLAATVDDIEIALITELMRIFITVHRGKAFIPDKVSEAFIHPRVERFVRRKCRLVPTVRYFV